MPKYVFTVGIQGEGKDVDEAWIDAVDSFAVDPGEYHDYEILDEEEDDGC